MAQVTSTLSDCCVGRPYLAYTSNILVPRFLIEPKILVEPESYIVAIKPVRELVQMEEVLLKCAGNGGLVQASDFPQSENNRQEPFR